MKIAPRELIWKDFKKLQREVDLLTEPEIEDLLLMQTIEGHAHNGDGAFNGQKFVDTTINDIVQALGRDVFVVRASRQMLIDEIHEYVEDCLSGKPRRKLLNRKGEPLMRAHLFRKLEVDPGGVMRGLFLGGNMDDFEVRQKVNERFGLNMGGGKPYLVDIHVMERMGLNGEVLAHGEHGEKIEEYIKEGLILEPDSINYLAHPGIRFQYIRHKKGRGVSDDLALIVAGKLYGISASLGVYLADAIDTLDKFCLKFVEQDGIIASMIERNFSGLNIGYDDLLRFIKLIAVPDKLEQNFPDSSQRYFLEINREYGMSALEAHLCYLRGEPCPVFPIAYERVKNKFLYDYVDSLLRENA